MLDAIMFSTDIKWSNFSIPVIKMVNLFVRLESILSWKSFVNSSASKSTVSNKVIFLKSDNGVIHFGSSTKTPYSSCI